MEGLTLLSTYNKFYIVHSSINGVIKTEIRNAVT